jgi:hypothetical protein
MLIGKAVTSGSKPDKEEEDFDEEEEDLKAEVKTLQKQADALKELEVNALKWGNLVTRLEGVLKKDVTGMLKKDVEDLIDEVSALLNEATQEEEKRNLKQILMKKGKILEILEKLTNLEGKNNRNNEDIEMVKNVKNLIWELGEKMKGLLKKELERLQVEVNQTREEMKNRLEKQLSKLNILMEKQEKLPEKLKLVIFDDNSSTCKDHLEEYKQNIGELNQRLLELDKMPEVNTVVMKGKYSNMGEELLKTKIEALQKRANTLGELNADVKVLEKSMRNSEDVLGEKLLKIQEAEPRESEKDPINSQGENAAFRVRKFQGKSEKREAALRRSTRKKSKKHHSKCGEKVDLTLTPTPDVNIDETATKKEGFGAKLLNIIKSIKIW